MKKARQPKEWDALTEAMSETIARNLRAVLEVAGGSNGDIKKMHLAELHRKTKISKSTLFKLLNENTENGRIGRPDLETLCGLAWALNLSPSFLLMSSLDWQRLNGAINGLHDGLNSPLLGELKMATTDVALASVGLKLAEKLGIYPDKIHTKLDSGAEEQWAGRTRMVEEINKTNEKKRRAILASTAIAQRDATAKTIELRTTIGAICGANFN